MNIGQQIVDPTSKSKEVFFIFLQGICSKRLQQLDSNSYLGDYVTKEWYEQ